MVIWSTTWGFIKAGVDDEHVPPFAFASARMLLGAVIMLGVLRANGESLPRTGQEWRSLGVMSFFMITIPYAGIYIAERRIPSGLAAVINAMIPVLVSVLAHYQLEDDRLTARKALGITVAFLGVAILCRRGFDFGPNGISLSGAFLASVGAALMAATSTAFATVLSKRHSRTSTPLATTAVQFLVGGVLLAVPAAVLEHREIAAWRPTVKSIEALLYLTVFGSCVAFSIYFWLVRHVKATTVSLISYLIPFLAISVGALVRHEPVTVELVVGLAAILSGAALVQFARS